MSIQTGQSFFLSSKSLGISALLKEGEFGPLSAGPAVSSVPVL